MGVNWTTPTENINPLRKQLNDLKENAKSQLRDNNLTLDQKWELLTMNEELFETSYRTDFGLNRDDSFLYEDPLYMSKYETNSVKSILESLKEDEDFELTEEEEIAFKQYCVDGMYSFMKFDW